MITKEQAEGFQFYLSQTAGKELIKALRKKAQSNRIDRDNPNPNAALYQAAQLALVRYMENLAGGNVDE